MGALFIRHPGEKDLALFAGGELGPLGRWRIEGHLEGCARCRQLVTEFFETRSKAMDLAELPAVDWGAIAQGIERRMAQERETTAPWAWRPAWGLAAAAVVLVVAGVWFSRLGRPAAGVWMDASAGAVELRVGDQPVLTLLNTAREETPVSWRVSADAASARYLDAGTGSITVNNVYAQ